MSRVEIMMGGLNCAHCAGVIEEKVRAREEVDTANLNFVNKKLAVNIKEDYDKDQVVDQLISIIDDTEPGLDISLKIGGHTMSAGDFRLGLSGQVDQVKTGEYRPDHEHGHEHEAEGSKKLLFILIKISKSILS